MGTQPSATVAQLLLLPSLVICGVMGEGGLTSQLPWEGVHTVGAGVPGSLPRVPSQETDSTDTSNNSQTLSDTFYMNQALS